MHNHENNLKASNWYEKGDAYFAQQQYAEATKCYAKAIKLCPKAVYWNRQGLAYSELENYKAAKDCYTKAITLCPDKAEYWNNKGFTYCTKTPHYEKAIKCIKAIKSCSGKSYENQSYEEIIKNHKKWFPESKNICEEANLYSSKTTELKPISLIYWIDRSFDYYRRNEHNSAVDC